MPSKKYVYQSLRDQGYIRVARYDEARRRSLWVRISKTKIELRAGREGGDSYAVIRLNGRTSEKDCIDLEEVASYAIYSFDETNNLERSIRSKHQDRCLRCDKPKDKHYYCPGEFTNIDKSEMELLCLRSPSPRKLSTK